MKFRFYWLLYLIPALLILFSVGEIIDGVQHPEQYPFGGEMFATHSIYASKGRFIFYHVSLILLLVLLTVASIKKWKKLFWALLVLSVLLFFYPMFTNGNGFWMND
jgi:hypothetical protein